MSGDPKRPCMNPTRDGVVNLPPIIQSPLDRKQYQAIKLSNGMTVLLISTLPRDIKNSCIYKDIELFNQTHIGISIPERNTGFFCCGGDDGTDQCPNPSQQNTIKPKGCNGKASACVVVGVGSFSDPLDVQGMAHFCEHSVMLGSKGFREPHGLFDLAHQHGGYINAATFEEYTSFHFDCDYRSFRVVLAAFSDAIASPILRHSSLVKEVAAVDSEFAMIETCDMTRISEFLGYLAHENHPFGVFHWGDKKSLGNIEKLPSKVAAWHSRYYTADRMTLCLQGPFPITTLRAMAVEYFKEVPKNKSNEKSTVELLHPYNDETYCQIYHLVPVSNVKVMMISWCLPPSIWRDFKTNELSYLSNVLSNQAKGGIVNYLHEKNWMTSFASGCSKSDPTFRNSYATLFQFSIFLTSSGLKNRDNILTAIFAYLKFLSAHTGVSKDIYEEMQKAQANIFHYHNWEETLESTQEYAMSLQIWAPEDVLIAKTLIMAYDKKKIENLLKLMDPRKANITVMAKAFENEEGQKNEMNGRFRYTAHPISSQIFEAIQRSDFKFSVPRRKTFVTIKDLGLPHPSLHKLLQANKENTNNVPFYEDEDGKFVVYFEPDEFISSCTTRRLPYAIFELIFHSPLAKLENKPLMEMWVYLLNLFLGRQISMAYDALYKCRILVLGDNLKLVVEGPSFHLTDFLKTVLESFESFEQDLKNNDLNFENKKTEQIENADNDMIDIQVSTKDLHEHIMRENALSLYHHKKKLERTHAVEFQRFVKRFKTRMFIVVHTKGSITSDQMEVAKNFIKNMKYHPYQIPASLAADRALKLPRGCSYLRIKNKNIAYHSSVIYNHYQFGPLEEKKDIDSLDLFHDILIKKAFMKLRTDEQLGYRVRIEKWEKCGCYGLIFWCVVKTDNFTTEYVDSRMDAFMKKFFNDNFQSPQSYQKLISKYLRKSSISFKDARDRFHSYLLPEGSNYRKLSIQFVGHKSGSKQPSSTVVSDNWLDYDRIPNSLKAIKDRFIQDVWTFKGSLEPLPNRNPKPEEEMDE